MKLPSFDYACPATIAEAVALLAAHGGEAKPIAGGQSLVPMLAFRLAAPTLLVDLRKLDELRDITIGDRGVTLGAMVRWRDILEHPRLRQAHPLLTAAVKHIAHYQIRNRGTVGGSLAHADPAAELPCIGEFARRRGDFALAAASVCFDVVEQKFRNVRIVAIGAADRPMRLAAAERALEAHDMTEARIGAGAAAAAGAVDPADDIHASGAYRKTLIGVMVERALRDAMTGPIV